jgi:glycosyltransferase involved in cell wall biosynthesis
MARPMVEASRSRVRVLRVIARLNMGGPAHHVGILGASLDPDRYETLLLHGAVGGGEGSLTDSVRARVATTTEVPGLGPELRPHDDARALAHLALAVRRFRPDIVHTHTAKAGMLGRLAAVLAGRPGPVIVHTYHGHVLEGYFDPIRTAVYRGLERQLGRASDRLIGVSSATVDDLVRLRVAPREKFEVIPIGLDLEPFLTSTPAEGKGFRREMGAQDGEVLLTFVGRLVPIKRVDVLLRAVALARRRESRVRLAIVGDGELRGSLEALASELGIDDRVRFAGYRADMVPVVAAADIAVLSSDNEGTPVSLIEAAAAGKPAAATAVGGVADVVTTDTGILAPQGDPVGLGDAIAELARRRELRQRLGENARAHVRSRFSADRLVKDIDRLYGELMAGVHGAPYARRQQAGARTLTLQ